MTSASTVSPPASTFTRLWQALREPSRNLEIGMWIILVLATFGIRALLVKLVPVALWSDDAGSYVDSAFRWVHTGIWESDPRRGPVYSLLIAFCTKLWGGLDALMVVQHVMGACAALMGMITVRLLAGRRAMLPILLCGYAYGIYGVPLNLEHLVRNETTLFFFSALTWLAWVLAIRRKSWVCLAIAGVACGMVGLTKGFVLGPCAGIILVACFFVFKDSRRQAILMALVFAVAFAFPTIGAKTLRKLTRHDRPSEPQDGILFYGRTAQFTYLEGGIEPEIKAQIRQEVEDYRKLPKLNNNLILKRTVVPHLRTILATEKKTPEDLNRLCRNLALEGISHHKLAYTKQVLGDIKDLLLNGGRRFKAPTIDELQSSAENIEKRPKNDRLLHPDETVKTLHNLSKNKNLLRPYLRWLNSCWLFRVTPVLLTTLLLPWLCWRTTGKERWWWLTATGTWYFSLVLLSTIGRPLDRYLIPVVPVMFITLTSAISIFWLWMMNILSRKSAMQSSQSI
ncbi:MAG: glycosyltransferase family 39 protein [Chthoniobacteraceae bacterium]